MLPTAELLVMETTRSAACPKQLSTKRNRRKRKRGTVVYSKVGTLRARFQFGT